MNSTTPTAAPSSDLDRLPKRLSPSRAKQFNDCPKSFFFKTIEKRPTKNTVANTRGTLAHTALEELFRLPRKERTEARAHTYVDPAWERLQEEDSYKGMVEPGSKDEADMLEYAREMVTNYFGIENPQSFDAGHLEYHAEAEVGGLALHGYIDRLDKLPIPTLENDDEKFIISDYKALALDTPIPTPTGWTTIRQVQPGDEVLGRDGAPVKVLHKSQVHTDRLCFEVEFDNAFTIIADEDHLWAVTYDDGNMEAVVTTETLVELLAQYDDVAVASADPLWMPYNTDLPVPPRALGLWLADDCPEDVDLYRTHEAYLRDLRATPSIPIEYLRASIEQRVALLDGLLANMALDPEEGSAVVYADSLELLNGFDELIFSLGGISRPGDTTNSRVLPTAPISKVTIREITGIKEVESRDTQCIEVDAPDSLFLAGRSMVPTHNTGKIPRDRYLDDAFFAMRIYALLLFEETGEVPFMLRLIYLKGKTQEEALRRALVTPEMLERTRRDVENIWRRIRTAAATGNWPTKTGPLCNYCDFKPICPAWTNEGTK